MVTELDPKKAEGIRQWFSDPRGQNVINHFRAMAEQEWEEHKHYERLTNNGDASSEDMAEAKSKAACIIERMIEELERLATGVNGTGTAIYLAYEQRD